MKIIYLKNNKKEIVFSKIVKNEDAKSNKTELMAELKYNNCRGYIVNLDSYEGVFLVKAEKPKKTKDK